MRHYKDRDRLGERGVQRVLRGCRPRPRRWPPSRHLAVPPIEKIREIHRSVVKSDLPPEEMARRWRWSRGSDLLMGEDHEEPRVEAAQVPRQAASWRSCYPIVKGGAVKYYGAGRPPVPGPPADLERLEEDPGDLGEVRGEGAHQRDERAFAGPALRLRALLEEEVQGGAGAIARPRRDLRQVPAEGGGEDEGLRILVGGWFSLPRLGRDVFAPLMKQGSSTTRTWASRSTRRPTCPAAVRTLSVATGEEVELTLRCFVCGTRGVRGCPIFLSATGQVSYALPLRGARPGEVGLRRSTRRRST